MRAGKLCPNLDRDDSLDTVLEVPIPDEMLINAPGADKRRGAGGANMRAWLKAQAFDRATVDGQATASAELPALPQRRRQASTAKYIIQQYIAATGGQAALQGVQSMYAVGKVRMCASEFHLGDQAVTAAAQGGRAEVGGFVLWQKSPEVWFFELIMAGHKMSAGSDGKVAWRQSAADRSHVSRGPPRPLRRSLQVLYSFCFWPGPALDREPLLRRGVHRREDHRRGGVLHPEAGGGGAATLRARSAAAFDINPPHGVGILQPAHGTAHPARGLAPAAHEVRQGRARRSENIFWETSMESVISDYRHIDGINIAHGGHTAVTLFRYGEGSVNHKRKLEETWTVEEADFNVHGLTADYFLPPADLNKDPDAAGHNK
ncbi:hypothetical protein PR202_gb04662 [Eleusine coracana subsp. coracana]|uniref:Uncharacterized protein n=1 Tax=Eleusine coracana subsp. coracana TaxID=191504 RepID=A0AAV5E4E0_ELECO|nr:hypothetical protein PR202_gb04662 [Eleusine coracana subsp. coracana]